MISSNERSIDLLNFVMSPYVFAAIGDLRSSQVWAIVLGVLFAIVAITLLVASWTRWGQTKSLTKCIALAFLAHVWLLMYAYGTRVLVPGSGGGTAGGARSESVMMSMNLLESIPDPAEQPSPAQSLSNPDSLAPDQDDLSNAKQDEAQQKLSPWEAPIAKSELKPEAQEPSLPNLLPSLPVQKMPLASLNGPTLPPELPPTESVESISKLANLAAHPPSAPSGIGAPSGARTELIRATLSAQRQRNQPAVPDRYQMRLSPHRQQFAIMSGGDANTEAAVEKALEWLARNQSLDGSWNAAVHGAGREAPATRNRTDSEYRHNAGLKANTAMTGLALLAFLGAGHTQMEGRYSAQVELGIRYLMSQQFPSGDLSGRDQVGQEPTVLFARMYSHGMAALALTEAYSMTGDPVLVPSIESACRYTQKAMNPRTGGWRYSVPTEDPGDTSQFGWQALMLNSAANNKSVTLEPQAFPLMQRFLDSVRTGRSGGLAVYRVRQSGFATIDEATPAMTAEALASRLLLGFPVTPAAAEEAQRMMLSRPPGSGEENLYYWYYATLAMYQLRGDGERDASAAHLAWDQWNNALKQQLCATQVASGPNAGSWNPTCIWGGYGGRVYSTATACMCMEVYYRYLPMYKADPVANQWQPTRR